VIKHFLVRWASSGNWAVKYPTVVKNQAINYKFIVEQINSVRSKK